MTLTDFSTYLVPTTVSDGNGKFYPAVNHGHKIAYWANKRFKNEEDAYKAASEAVLDALIAANSVIEKWNLTSLIS